MAKVKTQTVKLHIQKPKRKRPGIHAKTKTSKLKTSRNYQKQYHGQGH